MGCILLAGVLIWTWPVRERTRWFAAACCGLGTLAFISAFYSWKESYCYYCTLPLIGLAVLPVHGGGARRALWHWGAAGLAGLALLGTFSQAREAFRLWRDAGPNAATAGLWATPAEAAAWRQFTAENPPSLQPLLLSGSGAPEAIFPQYGPPWHGFLYPGEATPHELAELGERAARTRCLAYAPGLSLPEALLRPALALRPVATGILFATYGCNGQNTSRATAIFKMPASPSSAPRQRGAP